MRAVYTRAGRTHAIGVGHIGAQKEPMRVGWAAPPGQGPGDRVLRGVAALRRQVDLAARCAAAPPPAAAAGPWRWAAG